jgi:hypothetical protein
MQTFKPRWELHGPDLRVFCSFEKESLLIIKKKAEIVKTINHFIYMWALIVASKDSKQMS